MAGSYDPTLGFPPFRGSSSKPENSSHEVEAVLAVLSRYLHRKRRSPIPRRGRGPFSRSSAGSARSAASASFCRLSQISVSRSRIMSAVGPSLNSLARSRHLASLASSSALSCDEPILVRPAFGEKVRAIHVSIFALKSLERHIAATGDVKYFRNRIPCTGDNCHSGSSYCFCARSLAHTCRSASLQPRCT
jgi:hypothetical protein